MVLGLLVLLTDLLVLVKSQLLRGSRVNHSILRVLGGGVVELDVGAIQIALFGRLARLEPACCLRVELERFVVGRLIVNVRALVLVLDVDVVAFDQILILQKGLGCLVVWLCHLRV